MDIEKTLKNLKSRGFKAVFFPTAEEAADYIASTVRDTTVGVGGSVTVSEMGLYEKLGETNTVYSHHVNPGPDTIRLAASAEVYISSINGLSENGEIVNIDGRGNRVSSTLYGHKRIIFVCGTNKICPDLGSAVYRARNVAAPKNAARLNKNTPCVKAGRCCDCRSPERICNGFVVMTNPMTGMDMEVVIIDRELGL